MTAMRWVSWGLMTFLAFAIALLASRYFSLNPRVFFPEQADVYQAHLAGIILHVAGGVTALALGPFQFLTRLRARRPALHRWMGRVYLVSILVGGIAGLYVATMAFGGLVARTGFAALALLWLMSAFVAYRRIRAGDSATHRQWMIRNYALTFAAVTLRIQQPLASLAGIPFEAAYPVIAWTAWLPNLLVAEWLVWRMLPRRRRVVVG
jgi:uncharacterized membrane protein